MGVAGRGGRCSMVCVDDPRHARQSSLYRSRGLRPGHYGPARPRPRPNRGHPLPSPRPTQRILAPREEWIEIPVPALVRSSDVLRRSRATSTKNRNRKRDRKTPLRLVVAGVGRMLWLWLRLLRQRRFLARGRSLRGNCAILSMRGSEGYRFGGSPPCGNRSVRADQLEEIVWGEVERCWKTRLGWKVEYRRRLAATRDGHLIAMPAEIARLDRQSATLRRGIERLIDSYADGSDRNNPNSPLAIAGLSSDCRNSRSDGRPLKTRPVSKRDLHSSSAEWKISPKRS